MTKQPKKPYQTLEQRMNALILGSSQRTGNVFKLPSSNQGARLQAQINKELSGGK